MNILKWKCYCDYVEITVLYFVPSVANGRWQMGGWNIPRRYSPQASSHIFLELLNLYPSPASLDLSIIAVSQETGGVSTGVNIAWYREHHLSPFICLTFDFFDVSPPSSFFVLLFPLCSLWFAGVGFSSSLYTFSHGLRGSLWRWAGSISYLTFPYPHFIMVNYSQLLPPTNLTSRMRILLKYTHTCSSYLFITHTNL